MPVFKAVNKVYQKGSDFRNLVLYAANGKTGGENECGAQGVLLGDADSMYSQMEDVKKYFRKEDNRQALHYVLSFSMEEMKYIGTGEVLEIGYHVAGYFFTGWQTVFWVHDDTDNLHIHFVVNGTSYEDGRAFDMGPAGLQEIKQYVNVLGWHYYMKSLPEEERREIMFKKIGVMAEA